MDDIKNFLLAYGLTESEIEVYLACLQLGEASVLTLSKRAGTKRPTTYLILDKLERDGLVGVRKTKTGSFYHPLHPKKLMTKLKRMEEEYGELMPRILGLFHDKADKPIIGVYEDYDVYDRIADEVREYVKTGKEALYLGNSEYFYSRPEKVKKWFDVMKNKRSRCREILCGEGKVQREYAARVKKLGNPHYATRAFSDTSYPVVTEFAVWGDKVVFFSGTGKDLFTITVESKKLADTHRAIFDRLWASLG